MKKTTGTEIGYTILCVLISAVSSLLFTTFLFQRTLISGSSMEPTYKDGDNLLVSKISYKVSDPERFDVIVFPPQYDKDIYYIKRIIGLPGETIQIDEEGNIFVDDVLLNENYGKEKINIENIGLANNPITLKENEYFVMGDNRNNSTDSRTALVGHVKREDIIGKIIF